MIIEIKNLPEGRKVKHINFDISFEEDGSAVVRTNSVQSYIHHSENNTINDEVAPKVDVPKIHLQREHKEVPPEMKDLEF